MYSVTFLHSSALFFWELLLYLMYKAAIFNLNDPYLRSTTVLLDVHVSKMVKKLEALSTVFKTYYCAVVDQIEDQDRLTEEQAVLDYHEDNVEDLMERKEDLVETTETVMPHTSGMADYRPVVRSITEAEHFS